MKLATWNVNSLNVRLPQVLDFLTAYKPDVLCLQETKMADEKFPVPDFAGRRFSPVRSLTTVTRFCRVRRLRKSPWALLVLMIRKSATFPP